ncbi:MAG: tetratricopeptide repeat protein [Planctomycetota bacterium]|nr:tetratricopeptide repeat protein [Planctomycetota bacterium]
MANRKAGMNLKRTLHCGVFVLPILLVTPVQGQDVADPFADPPTTGDTQPSTTAPEPATAPPTGTAPAEVPPAAVPPATAPASGLPPELAPAGVTPPLESGDDPFDASPAAPGATTPEAPAPGTATPAPATAGDITAPAEPLPFPAVPGATPDGAAPAEAVPGAADGEFGALPDGMAEPDPNAEMIRTLMEEKKYDEAAKLLEESVKVDPKDYIAMSQLGVVYRMLHRYDDSIEQLTKAVEVLNSAVEGADYDKLAEVLLRRGIVWLLKGEPGIALADLEAAASYNFYDPRPEMWRGLALMRMDKSRDAIMAYTAALRLENNYTAARMNRALAQASLGEYNSAITDLNEIIRNNPTHADAYVKRAAIQGRLADVEGAISSYSSAIRLDPKNAVALYNRGMLYQQLGQSSKAAADRAQAQKLDPQISRLVRNHTFPEPIDVR